MKEQWDETPYRQTFSIQVDVPLERAQALIDKQVGHGFEEKLRRRVMRLERYERLAISGGPGWSYSDGGRVTHGGAHITFSFDTSERDPCFAINAFKANVILRTFMKVVFGTDDVKKWPKATLTVNTSMKTLSRECPVVEGRMQR